MRSQATHRVMARRGFIAAFCVASALASSATEAMTVHYQCVGYRMLSAEISPGEAQLHFEGKDWTLVRVRDAHEARYVDVRAKITVVMKAREMTFTQAGQALQCTLQSDALRALP
jgi:hypothetical protein